MATNYILPFAVGSGANVPSDADWAISDVLAQGFQQGRAASKKYNKAFRQSTAVASGFGQFTADYSAIDFTDSLSPQTMRDNFRVALASALDGSRMGVDTSSVVNQITFTLTPLPPTLSGNRVIWFKPNLTNTGPATATILKSDGTPAFSTLNVKRQDGVDPQSGDLVGGVWYAATCDGATLKLLVMAKSQINALIAAAGGGGGGGGSGSGYILLERRRSTNQAATAMTDATWMTWLLNTLQVNTVTSATVDITTGKVTLPSGTYRARFGGAVNQGGAHRCRLYNETGAVELGGGLTNDSYASTTEQATTESFGFARFTLSSTSVIRLDHINNQNGQSPVAYMGDDSAGYYTVTPIDAHLEISQEA